ncbi:hypothetical protein HDA32_002346 [Spinactinospora alkalitolerans]|uniref:Uncharacterized protein n=1 Tax=Spinactinospora alkalitolerans TaxID=687207 RepID=A0A852TS60_9ACTN|nr:hypothetical protein [Spinactinospora alkalitolerans]NYE47226.1 hypothetical protein [Spinactinospora alkalitolerans]
MTVRRILVAGIAAPALVLAAPAVAMADTDYEAEQSAAGPNGAWSHSVESSADGDGDASYEETKTKAGPHGAFSSSVESEAD